MQWSALGVASAMMVAMGLLGRQAPPAPAPASPSGPAPVLATDTGTVSLTLDTRPVSAVITSGDLFGVTLGGHWQSSGGAPVYLQASDSAGTFMVPGPVPAPKLSNYRLVLSLPTGTPAGDFSGTFTVRACADSQCQQVHPGTTRSIGYTLRVKSLGDWETLQRTSRHDGYVPVSIDAARYRQAWYFQRPTSGELTGVVTRGDLVYVSELGNTPSVRALRAADGVQQWRRVFAMSLGALNPPSVSGDVVYVPTTGHSDTWLYALDAATGLQKFQSAFTTQWANILNPAIRNGKVFVNAGYYGGEVFAFNTADGSASWKVSGGTYALNAPAVDDDFVYATNGNTLVVMDANDGTRVTAIGQNPSGLQESHNGTVMVGSPDHVLAFAGNSYSADASRQLMDYSVSGSRVRWMSMWLYRTFPAVANGRVYAASNESHALDVLDEATGRLLWSWKPPEQAYEFSGNVVVTDNLVFVSTRTRIYAVSLAHRRAVWSAPTPGTMAIGANRMLFVTTPSSYYQASLAARITAYTLD